MVTSAPSSHPSALALALGILLGLASHPANFVRAPVAVLVDEPPLVVHELEDTSSTTETTFAVAECPDVNLSRDCPDWPAPPRPLRVTGSGVWDTVEVPVVLSLFGVVVGEVYLFCLVGQHCQRRASEGRKRQPLGEVRLQLGR